MTPEEKKQKEEQIIRMCKALPDSPYGKYHYFETLYYIIGCTMGYQFITYHYGRVWKFKSHDEYLNCVEVGRRMIARGIIKLSRKGGAWRVC